MFLKKFPTKYNLGRTSREINKAICEGNFQRKKKKFGEISGGIFGQFSEKLLIKLKKKIENESPEDCL